MCYILRRELNCLLYKSKKLISESVLGGGDCLRSVAESLPYFNAVTEKMLNVNKRKTFI